MLCVGGATVEPPDLDLDLVLVSYSRAIVSWDGNWERKVVMCEAKYEV
jgi:hypothetical protein